MSFDLNTLLSTGQQVAIGQRETMGNPCMNNYAAGDGRRFWIVGLQGDRHWPALCRAVGRSDWLDDDRFATARARAANGAALIGELDAIFASRALDEWARGLRRRAGLLLVAGQLDRRRPGRRAVSRRRRRGLRARRRLDPPDGRHPGRLPRHALGADRPPRPASASTPRRSWRARARRCRD